MHQTTPNSKPIPDIHGFSFGISERRPLGKKPPLTPFKSPNSAPVDWTSYLKNEFEFSKLPIATGSFSHVYKVINKYNGTEYALKQIVKRNYQTEEYELANKVESSYTVKYIKKYQQGKDVAYLIEFEGGGSLDKRIENGPLPESDIKHVARDILKGLECIHRNNMAHLDIKPENILLNESGLCKIGDFGKAMLLDYDDEYFTFEYDNIEGDSRYMAPELLSSPPSTKADIYSLGITLLEIATTIELPSRGEVWKSLREGHIPEEITKGLSAPLTKIIEECLNPNPELRPTASELLSLDYFKTKGRRFSHPIKPYNYMQIDNTSSSLPNSCYMRHTIQVRESKKRKNEGLMVEDCNIAKKLSFCD